MSKRHYEATFSPPTRAPEPSENARYDLLLAPFAQIPQVELLNIKIGSAQNVIIYITNPTNADIKITFKIPKDFESRGFCLASSHLLVKSQSEIPFEISWMPREVGKWRDVIQVNQLEGIKKFGQIIFLTSSIGPTRKAVPKKYKKKNELLLPSSLNEFGTVQLDKLATEIEPTPIRRTTYDIPFHVSKFDWSESSKSASVSKGDKIEEENIPPDSVKGKLGEIDVKAMGQNSTHPPNICDYHVNEKVTKSSSFNMQMRLDNANVFQTSKTDVSYLSPKSILPEELMADKENFLSSVMSQEISPIISSAISKKLNLTGDKFDQPLDLRQCSGNLNFRCLSNIENVLHCKEKKTEIAETDIKSEYNRNMNATITLATQNTKKIISTPLEFEIPANSLLSKTQPKNKGSYTENEVTPKKSTLLSIKSHSSLSKINSLSQKSLKRFKKISPKEPNQSTPICKNLKHKVMKNLNEFYEATVSSSDAMKEIFERPCYKLDQYGLTTIKNPFAKNALFPPDWLDKQSVELIKWINSILTPPEELGEINAQIDLARLWKKVTATDNVLLAPSKEAVCNKFHKNEQHLYSLRKAAITLFRSEKISSVLYKVNIKVKTGLLAVKDDLDLHCDQGMRYRLVELLMFYNPLWLRIGLETVYGRPIDSISNNIAGCLVLFLKNNFLADKTIIEKNSYPKSHHYKSSFKNEMNDFIVFKFLTIIYFLDQAKMRRLIPYDPCLFIKSAPIKTSEEMLNEFIKDFIKCVGHMKRTLVQLGFILNYKQTYLDEFNYAVKSHLDLRNGICLTRMTEIILKDSTLCLKLRTPTVSRLQKIHNVKVALNALSNQTFVIEDVTAADIVDGHKEAIMSLLWQILHKFLAPRYEAAAKKIQLWWKKSSLRRYIYKRVTEKRMQVQVTAAVKIQSWWRALIVRKKWLQIKEDILTYKKKRQMAALTIQKWFRSLRAFKDTIRKINSVIAIQNWFRRILIMRRQRNHYIQTKTNVIKIQRWYRAVKLMKTTQLLYHEKRKAVILIQKWVKSVKIMRSQRNIYIQTKTSVAKIQQWYRSIKLMREAHVIYLEKRKAITVIQIWIRSIFIMKNHRNRYIHTKSCIVKIQQWYRAIKLMKKTQLVYQEKRQAAVLIQTWFRSIFLMKNQRTKYIQSKNSIIKIQRWYRGIKLMKKTQLIYQKKRKAAVLIQTWVRSISLMKSQRTKYIQSKNSIIKIQRWYRGIKLMKKAQLIYQEKRKATVLIQTWVRSISLMKSQRRKYIQSKNSIIKIQRWYRGIKLMKKAQLIYQEKRKAAVLIQTWIRSISLMKNERVKYIESKNSIIKIQRWYRGIKLMKKTQLIYQEKRQAAVLIQTWVRSISLMKSQRTKYIQSKNSIIKIQRWYRGIKFMKKAQLIYQESRKAAVLIQTWIRSISLMKSQRTKYIQSKNSIIKIQRWYRDIKLMKKTKLIYQEKRKAAVLIQTWVRSISLMKSQRTKYIQSKNSIITIQRWYRGIKLMKKTQLIYMNKINAILLIQRWFKGLLKMRNDKSHFDKIKLNTVKIQRWYRNATEVRKVRYDYLLMKKAVTFIQRRYRINRERTFFLKQRAAALSIQIWYRSCKLMIYERQKYEKIKNSVILIQSWYRKQSAEKQVRLLHCRQQVAAYTIQIWYKRILQRRKDMFYFSQTRNSVIIIQRCFRKYYFLKKLRTLSILREHSAIVIQKWYRMKQNRIRFMKKKSSALAIQKWYRNLKVTHQERYKYCLMHNSAIKIQMWFRGVIQMRIDQEHFYRLKYSAIFIQQWYREIMKTRLIRNEFLAKKQAAILLQRKYKTRLMNKQKAALKELISQEKKCFSIKNNAAVIIQAVWRGYIVRKKYKTGNTPETKQLDKVTNSYANESKDISTKTLSERFLEIEEIYMQDPPYPMNVVFLSFKCLDSITKYCIPINCKLTTTHRLYDMIWETLKAPCRSEAYQNVNSYGLNVFLNLSSFEETISSVWESMISKSGHVIILKFLEKYYKSNMPLFCKAATLLWIHIQCPEKAKLIVETSNAEKTIKYYYSRILQLQKHKPKRSYYVPKLYRGYNDKREFDCELQAIIELARKLNIKLPM